MFKNQNSLKNPDRLEDIKKFFEKLKEGIDKGEPCSLIIGEYLYKNIASDKVRKRKSSATEFEDFLGYSMSGKVMDNGSRKNIPITTIVGVDPVVATYLSSNRREKMDIIFPSNYGVSLKTSVPDNAEINMGSFAREALFRGFLTPSEYGGERKGGLGSKPQIEEKFKQIKKKGLWKQFCKRFEFMINYVYVDDVIFVIKGGNYFEVYTVDGKILREVLVEAIKGGPSKAISVINRYEGNSIRVERDKIISKGNKIRIEFDTQHFVNLRKITGHIEKIEQTVLEDYGKKDLSNTEKVLYSQIKNLLQDLEKI
ncbi:MAG: hypothetical protein FJZ43_04540 [Candidatus Staskawiczbacteria bacterium]|nr:hypothetical protein [Candidatus Staskawiczbacteria bacterium]